MRLPLVDLPELLLVINLDTDAILKHILDMLAALNRMPILVIDCQHFLEVGGMAPGNLDSSGGLGDVGEDSGCQAVLLDQSHVLLDRLLLRVHLISVLVLRHIVHRNAVS